MREVQMLVHRARGEYKEASKWATELMDAIDLARDDTSSYLRAVDVQLEAADALKKDDLAMDVTKKALERLPDNMTLKKNLAVMFARRGEFDQAMKIYEEVLQRNPNDYNANLDIGIILYNNQQWSEAVDYLEKVHELEPDNTRVIKMLMGAYFNTDQPDKGSLMQQKLKAIQGAE